MRLLFVKHPELKLILILLIVAIALHGVNCYNHTYEKLTQYQKELDAKKKELDAKKEANNERD